MIHINMEMKKQMGKENLNNDIKYCETQFKLKTSFNKNHGFFYYPFLIHSIPENTPKSILNRKIITTRKNKLHSYAQKLQRKKKWGALLSSCTKKLETLPELCVSFRTPLNL